VKLIIKTPQARIPPVPKFSCETSHWSLPSIPTTYAVSLVCSTTRGNYRRNPQWILSLTSADRHMSALPLRSAMRQPHCFIFSFAVPLEVVLYRVGGESQLVLYNVLCCRPFFGRIRVTTCRSSSTGNPVKYASYANHDLLTVDPGSCQPYFLWFLRHPKYRFMRAVRDQTDHFIALYL
jgi:hypothetical protein